MTKVDELRRLIAEGYTLENIESDRGVVEATLRRGDRVVQVRFFPSEAESLLFAPVRVRAARYR